MKDTAHTLITDKYTQEKTLEIVYDHVTGKYTHDFPITAERGCTLLGQDTTKLPIEACELMNLYKMVTPQRQGSEYVYINKTIFYTKEIHLTYAQL